MAHWSFSTFRLRLAKNLSHKFLLMWRIQIWSPFSKILIGWIFMNFQSSHWNLAKPKKRSLNWNIEPCFKDFYCSIEFKFEIRFKKFLHVQFLWIFKVYIENFIKTKKKKNTHPGIRTHDRFPGSVHRAPAHWANASHLSPSASFQTYNLLGLPSFLHETRKKQSPVMETVLCCIIIRCHYLIHIRILRNVCTA